MTSSPLNTSFLAPCDYEEPDTHIFVHALDVVLKGGTSILICGNDADIVVIATSRFPELRSHGLATLWVQYGKGKSLKYIPIHSLVEKISVDMALGLPFFHAFTSSDFTSGFRNYGKPTAWKTWLVMPEVTTMFKRLNNCPTDISAQDFEMLEKFVCVMYDRSTPVHRVKAARRHLFTKRDCDYEHIPPTQNVLELHGYRSVYVGGHMWGNALCRMLKLPSPALWKWKFVEGVWKVIWMSIDPLSKECRLTNKCRCTKSCDGNCGCFKSKLKCTPLCTCPCFT